MTVTVCELSERTESVKEVKLKKYKGSLILKLAIFASLIFVVATLVGQQVQIGDKQAQLAKLKSQIRVQEITNDEIKHSIELGSSGDAKYAEEYARGELDYAKPGERVFVNIGGN